MTKHFVLAGSTLAAAVALGPLCSAANHSAGPSQGTAMFSGVPQVAASQPLDEVAWRIRRRVLGEKLELDCTWSSAIGCLITKPRKKQKNGAKERASTVLIKATRQGDKASERSPFGNGCEPQAGEPPRRVGTIQIWKIRVGQGSRLYSACRIPDLALITCTSPASVRPSLPRLSLCVMAPSRT
jgi:hypothetical protein